MARVRSATRRRPGRGSGRRRGGSSFAGRCGPAGDPHARARLQRSLAQQEVIVQREGDGMGHQSAGVIEEVRSSRWSGRSRRGSRRREPLNLDQRLSGVVSGHDPHRLLGGAGTEGPRRRAAVDAVRQPGGDQGDEGRGRRGRGRRRRPEYLDPGSAGFSLVRLGDRRNSKFKKTVFASTRRSSRSWTIVFGGAAVGPIILPASTTSRRRTRIRPGLAVRQPVEAVQNREVDSRGEQQRDRDTSIRDAIARSNVALTRPASLFFKLTKAAAQLRA